MATKSGFSLQQQLANSIFAKLVSVIAILTLSFLYHLYLKYKINCRKQQNQVLQMKRTIYGWCVFSQTKHQLTVSNLWNLWNILRYLLTRFEFAVWMLYNIMGVWEGGPNEVGILIWVWSCCEHVWCVHKRWYKRSVWRTQSSRRWPSRQISNILTLVPISTHLSCDSRKIKG